MTKVGYMGIPFSNSEEAANEFAEKWGWNDPELVPLMTAKGVVDAVEDAKVEFGVVAASNVTAGPVTETVEAMKKVADIDQVDQVSLQIHHCVFAKSEGSRITTIVSHPQALAQCKKTLEKLYPDAKTSEAEDTAYAAKLLSEGKLSDDVAVLCRKNAGEFYNLTLIHENIEDRKDNETSFVLLRLGRCRACHI
jgi:prephenate dehydratase